MRRLIQRLRSWWNWLWGRPTALRTVRESDVPEQLATGVLYLVGEAEHLWFAAFLCPCGCGESIQLSLLTDSRPRWQVEEHDNGTVTVKPSVWRTKGCKSHFYLQRSLVVWVPDERLSEN